MELMGILMKNWQSLTPFSFPHIGMMKVSLVLLWMHLQHECAEFARKDLVDRYLFRIFAAGF